MMDSDGLWDDENPPVNEASLRRRVRAGLRDIVMPGDQRTDEELIADVFDHLQLTREERMIAGTYVYNWLSSDLRVRV